MVGACVGGGGVCGVAWVVGCEGRLLGGWVAAHPPRRLDALAKTEEDDDPGECEAAHQLQTDASHVVDPRRHLQHVVPARTAPRRVLHHGFLPIYHSLFFTCSFFRKNLDK